MVTTVAAEEVTQIWEAFKADPNNQDRQEPAGRNVSAACEIQRRADLVPAPGRGRLDDLVRPVSSA